MGIISLILLNKEVTSFVKCKCGAGLDKLPFQERANTAIMLNQQATYMSQLRESQLSQSFTQFTPEIFRGLLK